MVIRLKDVTMELAEDVETKRLRILSVTSKTDGAKLTLELPEALCEALDPEKPVSVVVDSKPIPRGEKARLYMQGKVFRVKEENGLEMVGTIGGLRLTVSLSKPTAVQKKTFEAMDLFLMIP
ncbi:MAG: hypothetical protein ACFE7R_00310 [Candidatus Hodarchaeota archaeon]